MNVVLVPAVADMDDETFIRHLEKRHPDMLRMTFKVEPGRNSRRMMARSTWEAFHTYVHQHGEFDHIHKPAVGSSNAGLGQRIPATSRPRAREHRRRAAVDGRRA